MQEIPIRRLPRQQADDVTRLLKSTLPASALLLALPLVTVQVQAQWEDNFFDSDDGVSVSVSVTGKALGWEEGQGHPKMRLTCEATSDGGNLGLGFHFPAEHEFLQNSVNYEPVVFKISGNVLDASMSGRLGRLTKNDTVFHTLLASEGRALTQTSAELIIDLMSGDTLDVHFAQFPDRYRVRYDLSGFAQTAMNTMHQCRTSGFAKEDVLQYWSEKSSIAELVDD